MIEIKRNQSKKVTIPVNRYNGFNASITLAAQAPTGINVVFDTQPGSESIVTVTASAGAALGQGQIVVTGNPPARNNSAVIQINVNEGTTTTTLAPTTTVTTTASPTTTQTPFSANAVIYTFQETSARYRFKGEVTYNSSYPVEYSWGINGVQLSGQEITYTFTSNGTYVVSLSVRFANNQYAYASVGPVVSGIETTTTTAATTTSTTTTTTQATTTTVDSTLFDRTKGTSVTLYRSREASTSYVSRWTILSDTLKNSSGSGVSSYYTFQATAVGVDSETGGELLINLGTITGPGSVETTVYKAHSYSLEVNVLRNGTRVGTFTAPKSSIGTWSLGNSTTETLPITWVNRA